MYRHARTIHRRRTAAVTGTAALTALALGVGVAYARPGPGSAGQAPAAPSSPGTTGVAPSGPVISPLPPVAPGCTVAPVFDEANQQPLDILTADPTGHYIIGSGLSGAALWVDGHRQALPDAFRPEAVNASGTIAGTHGVDRAAVVRNGTLSDLPTPSGSQDVRVSAINARGDVVGEVRMGGTDRRAVLWPAAGGVKVFSSPVSTALAIADDSTVYGTVRMVPTRWTSDGKGTPLPLPPGYHTGWASYPSGDQLFGEVAAKRPGADPEGDGKGELAGEQIYVRWHLGSGTVEQVGHPESGLYRTNATVDTVGVSGTIVATVDGKELLYRGNTPVALPQYQGRDIRIHWVSADGHTILGLAGSGLSQLAVIWTGC
ncbi:hypothetical protein ABT297_11545 [Dactylosporangium sp. NPDC000555]|uniref:hypothetical protein n=1 Tax=Dactylosporangium sp. NPDC000555 TaxID=3154260 RepID=UPI00332E70CA